MREKWELPRETIDIAVGKVVLTAPLRSGITKKTQRGFPWRA
jgi:hypothetical protein